MKAIVTKVFKFRFRKGTSGLAADLRAETCRLDGIPAHGLQVLKNLWLELPVSGLHWKDASWLALGAAVNAHPVSDLHPEGVLIRVVSLDYPLSDYRAEAAGLAMDGWLHEEFEIPPSGAALTYDTAQDRYTFSWGNAVEPFSDTPV